MKALFLAALLFLAPMSIAHAEPVTCEINSHDIDLAKGRVMDLKRKLDNSTDDREKMLLTFEGKTMLEVLDFLQDWRKKNCTDI